MGTGTVPYKKIKLGDISKVSSSKRIFAKQYVDFGIPFYRQKEIIDKKNKVEISDPLFISQETYDEIKKRFGVPQKGDLLITAVGVTLGIPYVVDDEIFYFKDGNLIWLREFDNEIDSNYIYYWILSDVGQKSMWARTIGSAQPALTIDTIKQFEIPVPSYNAQVKIVSILKAYDDLIENNQKQIKLLEEAAQRLYKEWFVDLRFPGYEDVAVVDGVPEGWTRKTVLECLEMHIGGGWGKETAIGKNTIPGKVIRGTDINDIKAGNFNDVPLRYHTENDRKKRALQAYDIVFELSNGNINNIGRSLLIDNLILQSCGESTICASFCKLFRPIDKLHARMLYWEIQEMQTSGRMMPFKKQGSNGINNFAFEDFLTHELLIPNNEALLLPIENIMKKTSNIQRQFALLSQARDRLLPKLMSGELEV